MLDMGEQIRIVDLAERMIRLRGLRPQVDIPIVFTGLRPGEKLHEQLLEENERREATQHSHIYRIVNQNNSTSVRSLEVLEKWVQRALEASTDEMSASVVDYARSL